MPFDYLHRGDTIYERNYYDKNHDKTFGEYEEVGLEDYMRYKNKPTPVYSKREPEPPTLTSWAPEPKWPKK